MNESLWNLNTSGKYKCINLVFGSHHRKDLPVINNISSIIYFDELEVKFFYTLIYLIVPL